PSNHPSLVLLIVVTSVYFIFVFTDTATTAIYTLSLHDALPISWPAEWQKFVTIVPIRDFKQQTRVRLGAFGSLPIVAEDTAYQAVTLTDSAATYVAQKRGNLVTVSRETIINDDLQAIKQIPTKLAVAAAYTLAEFVYGFLANNPAIYDGNNLFTSGAPHNN